MLALLSFPFQYKELCDTLLHLKYRHGMEFIVSDMADNDNPFEYDEEEIDEIVERTLSTILSNQRSYIRQPGLNISTRFYICPFCSSEYFMRT